VALAKLLLRPSNLLLLDEPTNHLDIATRERLEETLSGYPGTLVFATHDRYLVTRLATRVFEVADHGVRVNDGGYAEYQRAKAARLVEPSPARADGTPARKPEPVRPAAGDPREQRRRAAELRDAERLVTEAEVRLKVVEAALSDPSGHTADDLHSLSQEYAMLKGQVDELMERWLELAG
jgi:ATP-binding cassette, subfamily F, member 3